MQYTYDTKILEDWFEVSTQKYTSRHLVTLFENALNKLLNHASRSLKLITITTVVNKVLKKSIAQYPLLDNLKIDEQGGLIENSKSRFDLADSHEIKNAFLYLIKELIYVFSELTADIAALSEQSQQSLLFNDEETLIDSFEFKIEKNESDNKSDRLDCFYDLSKYLVNFESVEITLPKIILRIGSLVSLKSVLLLEKNDESSVTTIWSDHSSTSKEIDHILLVSKTCSDFFFTTPNTSADQRSEFNHFVIPLTKFNTANFEKNLESKIITIPLSYSNLEIFGFLQMEIISKLAEEDLRFINTFSNLIAVTLDRYNKDFLNLKLNQVKLVEKDFELCRVHEHTQELEKEREMREQFIMTLTHDLRTPLTAAKLGAQAILRSSDNVEKTQQAAYKIIKCINRSDQMINDLLDVSRIRAGQLLSLTMNYCNLREIVMDSLRDFSSVYGERFLLEIDKGNLTGFWNEGALRRVIENLVNNAVKYGYQDQVIKISIHQNKENIELSVHNFGPPIAPEEQVALFQPFHRLKHAHGCGKKGWGLGLTLVRGVAQAHGGDVRVKSDPVEGTTFILTLPKDSRAFQILN